MDRSSVMEQWIIDIDIGWMKGEGVGKVQVLGMVIAVALHAGGDGNGVGERFV